MDGETSAAPPPQASLAADGPEPALAPTPPWQDRDPVRAPRDPELDATMTELNMPYEAQPEIYLRLVANPFLGIFALVIWLGLMYVILRGAAGPFTLLAIALSLASLALLPRLLHYHCLDCGRTGLLTSWRRHICPSVVARRFEGRARRWHGPTPTVQVLLWLWFFAALLVAWQAGMVPGRR